MWQLWIVAVFPLSALQGADPGSKGGTNGSTQVFQDGFAKSNETVPENETNAPWRATWGASTTPLLVTVQSSTDSEARQLTPPTIAVHTESGTCHVLLSCAVAEGAAGDMAFTWLQANSSVVLSTAPTLRITQWPPQGTPDYICTIRNKRGESSNLVSLREHCQDPSVTSKGHSASFYAKYITPPLVVLVVLLVLFLMYRRKRGRAETHSSMESINGSSVSDSDNAACPSVEQTVEASFLPEAIKPLPENESVTETAAIGTEENVSDMPEHIST